MRPPPLAKIAAVAAPRPEAEPVTIAKNPSFDIPDFLFLLLTGRLPAGVGRSIPRGALPANRPKSVARNYSSTHRHLCRRPCLRGRPPCGHRRLSWHWLFPIIGRKKRRASSPATAADAPRLKNGERCGGE